MPLSHQDVLDQLAEIGLLSADDAANPSSALAPVSGGDSVEAAVAARLKERNLVTAYQARRIASDRIEELRLGDYIVEDQMGHGGPGRVLKARHRSSGRRAAVKVMLNLQDVDSEARSRLEREARAIASGSHPNLVRAEELGFDEPTRKPYLAMEHWDGVNLQVWAASYSRSKPSPWRDVCEFVIQAARGLAYLHDRKIAHLNLKPSQLIRTEDGTIKTIDWGLAKIEGLQMVASGNVGALSYSAPEICDGARGDHRSDIYSLGCILFFLATGRPPFEGTTARIIHAHACEPPPKLCEARPDADSRLESVFQRMMMKAPGKRQQAMQEVVAELTNVIKTWEPPAEPLLRRISSLFRSRPQREVVPQEEIVPETRAEMSAVSVGAAPSTHWPPKNGARIFSGRDAGDQRENNGLKMVFIWCPIGRFAMGSPRKEPGRRRNERLADVRIGQGFWMGQCPVTQDQWRALMGTGRGYHRVGGEGADKVSAWDTSWFPVENVTWAEAAAFCQKLTQREREAGRLPDDWEYRLPHTAQWEYACRAGTSTMYSFGDDESRLGDYAWFEGNFQGRTHRVGERKPNRWGLRDMHGNVWEWCSNLYVDDMIDGEPDEEARRPIRGGAFDSPASECRAAFREPRGPLERSGDLGFRVAIVSTLGDWGEVLGKAEG